MPPSNNHLGATKLPVRTASHGIPATCIPTPSLLHVHVMVSDKELEGLARPQLSDYALASDCTMAAVLSLLVSGLWPLAGSR